MESDKFYHFMDELVEKIKMVGYKPDDYVLRHINQEEKAENLYNHSEKLAVALLSCCIIT